MRHPTSRRWRTRLVAATLAVFAVTVGVLARANVVSAHPSTRYRTATVERASVTATLHRTGTIEPVSEATVAFPLAGTVATVDVHPGDAVTVGQQLATLDTTTLEQQLAQKNAALTQAQSTLDDALTAASAAAAPTTTTTPAPTSGSTAHDAKTVDDDQQKVDDAVAQAQASLATESSACSAGPANTTAAAAAGPGGSTTTTTAPAPGGSSAGSGPGCPAAEQQALADQQAVAGAEDQLRADEATLALDLAQVSSRSAPTAATPTRSAPAPTPEQIAADQAAVDAARAQVDVARQNLAQATIVSPISGSVAMVSLAVGQAVSAASSSADVLVVGNGGYEIVSSVAVADVAKVKVGDTATVVPDGGADRVSGQVVSIGITPTTSTTPTFPVVIGITGSSADLRNGASATVDIQTAHADAAVTVPTSAVHSIGARHIVTVLNSGKSAAVVVQTGAIGPDRTEITSGLALGQTVVLADLDQAIPASNSSPATATGAGFGAGGGFAGTRSGLGGGGVVVRGAGD